MQKIETKNNLDRMKKLGALFSRITVSEPLVLVASALAAGCIWVFIEIADEVFEGDTRQLDETILLALRNPENPADPLGPSWFEVVMRDFTALGGSAILVLLCLSVVGFLVLQKKKGMAFFSIQFSNTCSTGRGPIWFPTVRMS